MVLFWVSVVWRGSPQTIFYGDRSLPLIFEVESIRVKVGGMSIQQENELSNVSAYGTN